MSKLVLVLVLVVCSLIGLAVASSNDAPFRPIQLKALAAIENMKKVMADPMVAFKGIARDVDQVTCSLQFNIMEKTFLRCSAFFVRFALVFGFETPSYSDVDSYCHDPCREFLQANITAVGNCGAFAQNVAINLRMTVRTIQAAIDFPCTKSSENSTAYCIIPFISGIKLAINSNGYFVNHNSAWEVSTSASLTTLCTGSCLPLMFQKLFSSGDAALLASYSASSFLCMKDSSKFCFVEVLVISSLTNNTEKIIRTCSTRCFKKYVTLIAATTVASAYASFNDTKAAIVESSRSSDSTLLGVFGLCTKNENGQYCGALDINTIEDKVVTMAVKCTGISNTGGVTTGFECTSGCKDAVQDFFNFLGCCLGRFASLSPDSGVQSFLSSCGLTLPGDCGSRTKSVIGSLKLLNLRWTYVAALLEQVKADLKVDLAANAGVLDTQISVTVSESVSTNGRSLDTASSTDVQYTISPDDDSDSSGILSDMNAAVTSNTLLLPTVSSYDPTTSRIDTTQGMTVDQSSSLAMSTGYIDTTSTAGGGGGGAGSVVQASFLIVLGLMFAVLLL